MFLAIKHKHLFLNAVFVVLACFIFLGQAYSGNKQYEVFRDAREYLLKGQEYFRQGKLIEAHSAYDQAIQYARRSMDFKRSDAQKHNELKEIIRQSRNEKSRIRQKLEGFQSLIQQQRIARGMSQEQVIASWGQPRDIEKVIVKWKECQKWYYGNVLLDNNKYVFFENARVVDWADDTKK